MEEPTARTADRVDPRALSVRARLGLLGRDSVVYGTAAAVNAAFSLLTFPLLARHFSSSDYGVLDFFSVIAGLLTILVVCGQDSAVARFFHEHTSKQDRRQLVSQALLLQIILACGVCALLLLLGHELSGRVAIAAEHRDAIRFLALQLPFQTLLGFALNLLKWTFAPQAFVIVSIGSVALRALLLVLGVAYFGLNIADVFLIAVVVAALFGGLGVYLVRDWLEWPRSIVFWRTLLPFGVPYAIIGAVEAFVPTLERTLVLARVGDSDLGIYAAGAKVALLLMLPAQAFHTAWGPLAIAVHKEADATRTYSLIARVFAIGAAVLVLLLASFAKPLIDLLASSRYGAGAAVVFPLALAMALHATSWITEIGIVLSKRSHLELAAPAALLCVAGVAIFAFAGRYGAVGVAYGVLCGYAARVIVATWVAQRAYAIDWPYLQIILAFCYVLAVGLPGHWLFLSGWILGGQFLMLAGALVAIPLAFTFLWNASERTAMLASFRRMTAWRV
jgi:O-antigen/teichoic acid export membrane protein